MGIRSAKEAVREARIPPGTLSGGSWKSRKIKTGRTTGSIIRNGCFRADFSSSFIISVFLSFPELIPGRICFHSRWRQNIQSCIGVTIGCLWSIIIVQDRTGFRHIQRGRFQKPSQTGTSAFPVSPLVRSNLQTADRGRMGWRGIYCMSNELKPHFPNLSFTRSEIL